MVESNLFIEFTGAMETLAEERTIDLHNDQARTSLFDDVISLLNEFFDPFIPDPFDVDALRARFDRWVSDKRLQ